MRIQDKRPLPNLGPWLFGAVMLLFVLGMSAAVVYFTSRPKKLGFGEKGYILVNTNRNYE